MANKPFPLVVVEGDAFERGYQHGSQARERVRRCIEVHGRAIKHFSGMDWEQVVARADDYLPFVRSYAPEMVDELKGIAEGSGLPFEDVLGLNLRYELTFTPKMAEGCTCFALLPEATADGHTYVGQTWDNLAALGDACIVLRVNEGEETRYVTFTEAGVPAMIGLNRHGIGVARNALVMVGGGAEPGVPINAVHWRVLRSEIVSDAVGAVLSAAHSSPMNYVIGAPGDAISLEAAPHDVDYSLDVGGIITHANHFTSGRLRVKDLGKVALPDSLFRDHRLRRSFSRRRGSLDVAGVYDCLQDHFNYPDSVCRHPDQRDGDVALFESVVAVVMDLEQRTMFVTDGPPCSHPYRAISLAGTGAAVDVGRP